MQHGPGPGAGPGKGGKENWWNPSKSVVQLSTLILDTHIDYLVLINVPSVYKIWTLGEETKPDGRYVGTLCTTFVTLQ